ncbi:MAG: hypothetical protein DBX55_08000 [Verrucomicrobia bacterium]|nr:MAG: hypothetical protein DBX55_08000 [Verrucomicrobiota bacterium]
MGEAHRAEAASLRLRAECARSANESWGARAADKIARCLLNVRPPDAGVVAKVGRKRAVWENALKAVYNVSAALFALPRGRAARFEFEQNSRGVRRSDAHGAKRRLLGAVRICRLRVSEPLARGAIFY